MNAATIRKAVEEGDATSLIGQRLSLRSKPKRSDHMVEVLMGDVEEEINPYSGQLMLRRLDVRKPEKMWLEATFELIESERVPSAYYVPAELKTVIERLQAHGIRMERLTHPETLELEEFQIASKEAAAQAVEKHQERTVAGSYHNARRTLPAGTYQFP